MLMSRSGWASAAEVAHALFKILHTSFMFCNSLDVETDEGKSCQRGS